MAKKNDDTKEKSLENFDWDNQGDFFGVAGTAVETIEEEDDVVTKVKEEEDDEDLEKQAKTKTKKKAGEEESEEDEDEDVKFFEKSEDDEDEDGEGSSATTGSPDGDDDEEEEIIGFGDAVKAGLFKHIEIKDDEEITLDRLEELQQENLDNYVDEFMDGLKEDAGEDGVAFMKFVGNGGNPKEFFRLWKESSEVPEVNIEEDDGQDSMIRYYLQNYTEYTKDEINDHLEWLDEKGKKKAYAQKYEKIVNDNFEKQKKELIDAQKAKAKALEKSRIDAANNVKSKLSEVDKIGNYNITKDDKKTLVDVITKATVKIGDNRYITPLQAKIAEMYKDPEKLILFAKQVMSDFDTSDIELEAATKVTKNVRKKLVTSGKKQLSSKPKSRNRNLSDFF